MVTTQQKNANDPPARLEFCEPMLSLLSYDITATMPVFTATLCRIYKNDKLLS